MRSGGAMGPEWWFGGGMGMPRNRAERGRQCVGGGGKGGMTGSGVRGAGNGRDETAPFSRPILPLNAPMDDWPTQSRSMTRCRGISISNFRIPNSV